MYVVSIFAGLYSQGKSHVAIVCPNSIASESQTWQEALESSHDPTCAQPKQYLSSNSLTEFLEGWAKWNSMTPEYMVKKIRIVDMEQMNMLVLIGPSNCGKSLVAKSICDAFRKMGLFIQNNNTGFMHQSGIGMSIWLHEEPVIIDYQQELYLN